MSKILRLLLFVSLFTAALASAQQGFYITLTGNGLTNRVDSIDLTAIDGGTSLSFTNIAGSRRARLDLSGYATTNALANYYPNSNPSNYIAGVSLNGGAPSASLTVPILNSLGVIVSGVTNLATITSAGSVQSAIVNLGTISGGGGSVSINGVASNVFDMASFLVHEILINGQTFTDNSITSGQYTTFSLDLGTNNLASYGTVISWNGNGNSGTFTVGEGGTINIGNSASITVNATGSLTVNGGTTTTVALGGSLTIENTYVAPPASGGGATNLVLKSRDLSIETGSTASRNGSGSVRMSDASSFVVGWNIVPPSTMTQTGQSLGILLAGSGTTAFGISAHPVDGTTNLAAAVSTNWLTATAGTAITYSNVTSVITNTPMALKVWWVSGSTNWIQNFIIKWSP